MGLPDNWSRVRRCLHYCDPIPAAPEPVKTETRKKCPELKKIVDYSVISDQAFWETFPFNELLASDSGIMVSPIPLVTDLSVSAQLWN
jgi:hypothetical protein